MTIYQQYYEVIEQLYSLLLYDKCDDFEWIITQPNKYNKEVGTAEIKQFALLPIHQRLKVHELVYNYLKRRIVNPPSLGSNGQVVINWSV